MVCLPHTNTTEAYATCAYTQKIRKFARAMYGCGRDLILYGGEENDALCDEHVVVVTAKQQRRWFGTHDEGDIGRGGFDWDRGPWWDRLNAAALGAIRKRRRDERDLLLVLAGQTHRPLYQALPDMTVAEFGVGYKGIILDRANAYAAFESHAHRHFVYGWHNMEFPARHGDRYAWDTVIPNLFDPEEGVFGDGDGGYLLFVGRLVGTKGPQVASEIAQRLGMRLVVAGHGVEKQGDGWIEFDGGQRAECEYVGTVGIAERAELMAGAVATLMPTFYIEPFGGVAVESMLCGTPVVATNMGAFTETVVEGVTGYRFHTMAEACLAVEKAARLDRWEVRKSALDRFSLDAVAPQYQRWFGQLDQLRDERGWYA